MIFKIWLATVFAIWAVLVSIGPGFDFYTKYWIYPFIMVFGSSVAGFTPEGGGAVAFPILNLYIKTSPSVARDFSLAIQCIGMVSASIYIITRKNYGREFYKPIPLYVGFSSIGFLIATNFYNYIPVKLIQSIFMSLALAFITSFWIGKKTGTKEVFQMESKSVFKLFIFCFFGGVAGALFGTGSDMLIYVFLSTYYGMKEKIATDTSIIVMACISVLGVVYKIQTNDVQPKVYWMWLAAVPSAAIFGPLGNKILKAVETKKMLAFVLVLNIFNWIYFISNNHNYGPITIITSLILLFIFLKMRKGAEDAGIK